MQQHIPCKQCKAKIPVIALRQAHWNSSDMPCPGPDCPRELSYEEIDHALDKIDARRLRGRLFTALDKGKDCPCCDQFAKRYRRKLNTGIARWLIALLLLEQTRLDWVHIAWIAAVVAGTPPTEAKELPIGASPIGSGDYAKARFWDLIEAKPNDDPAKHDSGYWRLTERGRDFVRKRLKVPAYVLIYNGKALGLDGDPISIDDALGEKFHYAELMSGR